MRSTWLAYAAAAAALLPATASAQASGAPLRANNPEAFRQALVEAGYEADLYSSDQGSARINAHRRGSTGSFNVDFGPCENDDGTTENCQSAKFSSPYSLDSVPAVRASWNRSRGRPENSSVASGEDGYNGEVSMALEMEVDIPETGLPRADFLTKVRSWQAMFEAFERLMAR